MLRHLKIQKSFKKGLLFLSIFCLGLFLSSFYYEQQRKTSCVLEGFPMLSQKGYQSFYDTRLKIPLWTHEHLTKKNFKKAASRKNIIFYENAQLYPLHRSTLSDYYRSGYDRGHMAACANQSYDMQSIKETFLLTNVCPQHAGFNRGIWLKLEERVRDLANQCECVDVISGPLFLPIQEGHKKVIRFEVIGENEVAVPTHFYKVLQIKSAKGLIYESYLLPNQPISSEASLASFQTSIEEIEQRSGIFFRSFHPNKKRSY